MTEQAGAPPISGGHVPDIAGKLYEAAGKRREVYPVHVNRASQIGDPCMRALVYLRLKWKDQELYSIDSQLIFDEGNNQEPIVIRDINKLGYEVIESQRPFDDERTEISGHIDGVLADPETSDTFPLEIKSCSPHVFDRLIRYGLYDYMRAMKELGSDGMPWLLKYPAQIHLYLYFKGKEWGIVLFKNKSTGQIKQFNVKLDLDYVDAIFKKANIINECVRKYKSVDPAKRTDDLLNSVLPERIKDRDVCAKCNFKMTCLPDIDFGSPLKMEDDPLFEEKVNAMFKLESAGKEYAKISKRVKEMCRGRENSIVGKYHITGKQTGSGWRSNISLIEEEKQQCLKY